MDSSKKVVYDSWRPLIITSQFFGLTFFTNRIPFFLTFIYRMIILTILVLILIDQLPVIIYWTRDQTSKVDKTLQLMKISIAWANYFLDFLITCFRSGFIQKIINDIVGMNLILSNEASKKILFQQILRFTFSFIILLIFQILSVHLSPPEIRKAESSPSYIFIDSLMTLVVMQFVEFVSLMKEYFKCFGIIVAEVRGKIVSRPTIVEDAERCEEINRLRILHFTLIDICKAINEAYEVQLLLVLIRCFIEATTVSASLMKSEKIYSYYIFRITQIGYNLMLMAMLCFSCDSAINESKRVTANIARFSNTGDNRLIRDEFRLLSVQMLRIPLRFTVLALFNLNVELVLKIIIAMLSYLSIIYTFQSTHNDFRFIVLRRDYSKMLGINNLDEGKTNWINETQLIIPLVDSEEVESKELEGISKHTITLNSLDGADQTLIPNENGPTLMIGLDRTLFENNSCKSDLLLMPSSDMKLIPSVSDAKINYTLPALDQPKNEIIWENETFEKPLTKDIMNVIQDTSKDWNETGKNNELCMEDLNSVSVHENKINADFLMDTPLNNEMKKSKNDNSYLMGYYPVEGCDTVLVPASFLLIPQKTIPNMEAEKAAMVIENAVLNNEKNLNQIQPMFISDDVQTSKWMKCQVNLNSQGADGFTCEKVNNESNDCIIKENNTPDDSLTLADDNVNKMNETVIPMINLGNDFLKTAKEKSDIIYDESRECANQNAKFEDNINGSNILPEQSLPLKKKAKMKKSPICGNNSFSSNDNLRNGDSVIIFQQKKVKLSNKFNGIDEKASTQSNSDSDEPLSNLVQRKNRIPSRNGRTEKVSNEETQTQCSAEMGKRDRAKCLTKDRNRRYKNIIEILEYLKKEKLINDYGFKILYDGLQEMRIDILKEIYKGQETKSYEYSPHLKAFALMLNFLQPAAFNRLAEIFHSGWPPLTIIKAWKKRLNSELERKSRNSRKRLRGNKI